MVSFSKINRSSYEVPYDVRNKTRTLSVRLNDCPSAFVPCHVDMLFCHDRPPEANLLRRETSVWHSFVATYLCRYQIGPARRSADGRVINLKCPKPLDSGLLFKYVEGEFTPLSKPFKTKEQAEKTRLKYPERERKTIGLGVIRLQKNG
jgi:hypothetical protein